MKTRDGVWRLASPVGELALALLAAYATPAPAGTVWTGPLITYTQPAPFNGNIPVSEQLANVDQITDDVWLTRPSEVPLINAAPPFNETFWSSTSSPANTLWAVGTLANTNLTYSTWYALIGGPGSGKDLHVTLPGTNFVVYLESDDIYLSITFTEWGGPQGSGFTYQRSTAPPPAPTVSITNPVAGAVFSAPATLNLGAAATVSSGTVTNVAFFANDTNLLGSAAASPFNITAGSLPAGDYSLTAVATAAGVSTTSPVVNISVVNPVAISNSAPAVAGGQFSFSYSVNVGLTYVVQSSSDLSSWVPAGTNIASVNPATFSEGAVTGGNRFYRVVLQPNP